MKCHVAPWPEEIVAAIGGGRDGIVRSDLAHDAGVLDWQLGELRDQGRIISLGRGADRLRDHPVTHRSQCRAALDLAGPDAALCRRTAARFHEFYAYRACDVVEVVVPRGRDHRAGIGVVVQSRWLPAEHLAVVDGFPVTTPARTFFDLCADPDPGLSLRHPYHRRAMARVYNDAVARRGLTFTMQVAVLAALAKRGRSGTRLVRSLLLELGPDHEPPQSDVESMFVELLDAFGVPQPARQVPLSDDEGWVGTVDFCWPAARLVVEIDSTWHDGPLDRRADAERDARLRRAGYTVLRVRFRDLVGHGDRVVAAVLAVLGAAARDNPE